MKFISTFTDGKIGVGQELGRFLSEKGEDFWFLEHPLVAGRGDRSRLDTYKDGVVTASVAIGSPRAGLVGQYLQCVLLTFGCVLRRRAQITTFVGHSNIDCVAARLATLGRKVRIVYVSIDYTPKRFPNPFLNRVFRLIDRLAYRWSTDVWHSYPDVFELKPYARPENCVVTFHGNNFRRIRRPSWEDRKLHGLVYLGGVVPPARLDLALSAVADIAPRFPDVTLDVIGDASDSAYLDGLKKQAEALGIGARVTWHGLVTEQERFEEIMVGLGVALCLYEMTPDLPSWYQLPGKVFAYAACGLPTVVLDKGGPVCCREIRNNGIGLVSEEDGLSECIAGLLADASRHETLSETAVRWASEYDWSDKFRKYLEGQKSGVRSQESE